LPRKTVNKLFTKNGVPNKDAPKHKPPPLTLVVEVQTKDELDLRKSSQFTLKINAKDTSKKLSKVYKFTMYHIDGTETLRQTIQWYKDIQQVITGMNTTEAEQMTPLIEGRCEGSALAAFQDTLTTVQFKGLNIIDQQMEQEQGEQKADETAEEYKTPCTEARAQLEATTTGKGR
jgi:hypothetical protein